MVQVFKAINRLRILSHLSRRVGIAEAIEDGCILSAALQAFDFGARFVDLLLLRFDLRSQNALIRSVSHQEEETESVARKMASTNST